LRALEHFTSQALFDFAQRAAVPLFRAEGDHGNPFATGTFMKVNGKLALLTARHILDECHPKDIAIPQHGPGSHLSTLGPLDVIKPVDLDDLEFDVIAIELTDPSSVTTFTNSWTVLDDAIGMSPIFGGTADVLIVGYPSALFVIDGYKIQSPPPLVIETSLLTQVPKNAKKPIADDLDLFFDHSDSGCTIHSSDGTKPHPGGMSGCSIWQIAPNLKHSVWLPENDLRLIGIQSSALPGKFLRGKNWDFVAQLLKYV
jgi:hypothetical protein